MQQLPNSANNKTDKYKRAFMVVWACVGTIILTVALVQLLNILSVPVSILLWTIIIVFCLRGIVNGLEKRGVSRVLGTTIAYIVFFVVIGLIGFLMFSPVFGFGEQFTNIIESIPSYAESFITWVNSIYNNYSDVLQNETVRKYINEGLNAIGSTATDVAKQSADGAVAFGAGVANTFLALGFALVIAFWFLVELPAMGRETMRLAGSKHKETMQMLHLTFTRVMGGYIKGTLFQCAIIGVLCGILFAILGLDNYAALGGITGILNIIPIVGPWLGGALAGASGIFTSPISAVIALVGTIAIQQVVYTFISPKIMQSSVDIHPALNIIALMAGSAIGGAMSGLTGSLVGMLASIPAVAVMKSVFVYYFEKITNRQLVAPDGVFFKGKPSSTGTVNPVLDAAAPTPETTGGLLSKAVAGKELNSSSNLDAQDKNPRASKTSDETPDNSGNSK